MDIQDVLSVSGLPGLYTVVSNRSNGLIVEHLTTAKRQFAPARKHQFSPLETIGIYTLYDTIELKEVLIRIHERSAVPDGKDKLAAQTFFAEVIPEYDVDRVRASDIQRVLKWYHLLATAGRLRTPSDEEE